jgi:hypothetical protein
MAGLDGGSVKRVLEQCHWRWSESDPKSMAEFLASAGNEAVPVHVYSNLARNMARQDPLETLEWTSRLSGERGFSAGSEAFTEWRRSQPESAMKWLNDLPPSDPRRRPFLENVIRSLAYDPRGVEQLAAMAANERAAARGVIANMNLSEDRRARLLEALKSR